LSACTLDVGWTATVGISSNVLTNFEFCCCFVAFGREAMREEKALMSGEGGAGDEVPPSEAEAMKGEAHGG
jgi:hypothetical protein